MHTYTSFKGFRNSAHTMAERRLCFLDAQGRKDLVEEAEQTDGKMNGNSLNALESNTEKILKEVDSIKVGWGEWINHFFRSSAVIQKKTQSAIMRAAEAHIQEESDLAVGRIRGIFQRGKRRLYLASKEKIAEQIRTDMYTYLQAKQKEAQERGTNFGELAALLSENGDPLQLNERDRVQMMQCLERVGKGFQEKLQARDANGEEMPPEWEKAAETDRMLRQQLITLDIAEPSELEQLLKDNRNGDTRLQRLIESAPKLVNDKKLRKCLVNAVKELRSGFARFYNLQKYMENDVNAGTFEQRLANVRNDRNIIGRKFSYALAGRQQDTYVVHRGDTYLTLRGANDKQYSILDVQTGEVTYRDAARKFHDLPLKDASFNLQ